MPRIVNISDTHCQHRKISVPDGDILFHCGDITGKGELNVIEDFCNWLKELPHKHKVVIMGNHDILETPSTKRTKALEMLNDACTYLEDSGVEIDGLKIYGSPVQPWFYSWAYNRQRGEEINHHWKMIPDDIDALLTHGPPMGIMDEAPRGSSFENVGCQDLLNRVNQLPNLKLHAYGHIHEGYGQKRIGNTLFVNASTCNGAYLPINPPVVIDL